MVRFVCAPPFFGAREKIVRVLFRRRPKNLFRREQNIFWHVFRRRRFSSKDSCVAGFLFSHRVL